MKDQSSTRTKEKWLTLKKAVEYLGVGKTILYVAAREGRIPANKLGKKWVFEKSQLDGAQIGDCVKTSLIRLDKPGRRIETADQSDVDSYCF